ncbi:hypothetical protein V6N13_129076 [Hibiscus sabdariffa]
MHPKPFNSMNPDFNVGMASSMKVSFRLSLLALLLISIFGFRFFLLFLMANQEVDEVEIIDMHFESVRVSDIGRIGLLAVEEAEDQPKASIESKQFRSSGKPSLVKEGRKAIKASIERHGGHPFEPKRQLSPGRRPNPLNHH